VLQGLEHLHACHFFHNDIKPENILIGPNGQAKLGDYGVVGISQDGQPVPPPAQYVLHAAPETATGHGIESRTDIFQAGLTLFRLLTGLGALSSKLNAMGGQAYGKALASGRLITDADFPVFVPRSVARIVKKAIDPNPALRFQSALEMRRALEKLSFRGYWTVEANGFFVGYDEKHRFRFETTLAAAQSAFQGFKLRLSSGRETRISAFTSYRMTASEAKRREIDFIRSVIAGQAA
jgi:serine/threonine protein kinase